MEFHGKSGDNRIGRAVGGMTHDSNTNSNTRFQPQDVPSINFTNGVLYQRHKSLGLHANDFQKLASAISTSATNYNYYGGQNPNGPTQHINNSNNNNNNTNQQQHQPIGATLHNNKVSFCAGVAFERFAEPPDRIVFTRDSFFAMLCAIHATDLASPRTLMQSAFYAGEEFRKAAVHAPDYGLTYTEFENMVKHSYFSSLLAAIDLSNGQDTNNRNEEAEEEEQQQHQEKQDRVENLFYSQTPRYPSVSRRLNTHRSTAESVAGTAAAEGTRRFKNQPTKIKTDDERQAMMAKQLNQRNAELETCEAELMAEEELGTTLPAAYDSGRVALLRQRADELRTAANQLQQRLSIFEKGIPVWQ